VITAQYCRTMAQYNQWQNNGLRDLVKKMSDEELQADRGAFFGSIFATMNHLLWGDLIWLSRFGVGEPPSVSADKHKEMTPNKSEWDRRRFLTDGQIKEWAASLKTIDLSGDLTWYSGMNKKDMTTPMGICVTHFFNHQTHHRGQIHAMMTSAGQKPIDTDLAFMAET